MTTPRPLTAREVAQHLEVDVRTVHRMVARGVLPYVFKAPGSRGAYLFDPAAVAALEGRPAGSTHAQGAPTA